jgi:hypothetical protein
MKRTSCALVIVSLVTTSLAAQDLRLRPSFIQQGATASAQAAPQPRQGPPPAGASQSDRPPLAVTIAYGASLGIAVGGTAYVVNQTRRALDHHLDVRTFPLVWVRSSDPKDKGRVTATLWASNTIIMVGSFLAFRHHQYKTAVLLNAFVATLTFVAGVRERNTINGK